MYGVLSLRSHRVPSVGALYRFLPAWLRRTAAAALTLGTIGALGAISVSYTHLALTSFAAASISSSVASKRP